MTTLDAGKRIADIINGKVVAHPFDEIVRSFMAFDLGDGESDGILYPSVREARAHQKKDFNYYVYFCLREAPGGITAKQAWAILTYARAAYDAGMRMPDPESTYGDYAPVAPLPMEDQAAHLSEFLRKSGFSLARYVKE